MKKFLEYVEEKEEEKDDEQFEEGSLLPSERNDQKNYRNTNSGSKVPMKYWRKSEKTNYKPDKMASLRAKRVHKGDYNA